MKTPANHHFFFKLLKPTHFITLSVIVLFLMLGSCESETVEPLSITDSDADLHLSDPIKRLNLNDFLQTAIYKKVEQELEQRQSGSKSLSKGNSTPSDTGYTFVSDEVYEATSPEGQVTYTAAIQTTPGYNPDYSENLMIIETQEGPKIYIVKYPRDGSEKVFLQPVNTNPDDINTNSLNCFNRSWRSVIPCTGKINGVPVRHTDPAKCSCTGVDCSPPKINSGEVLICILPPTGPNSPGGGNYGGSQNSNGNSNYSGGCDDPDCLQEPPVYIYEGEEECFPDGTCTPSLYWVYVETSIETSVMELLTILNTIGLNDVGLTEAQKKWISNPKNNREVNLLLDFLDENKDQNGNYTDESISFAKEVVQILSENSITIYTPNNYPGKNDGMPFEWWLDENFVDNNFSFDLDDEGFGDLTKEEKLLVITFPAEALIIRANKEPAEIETENRFGFSSRNDKSDAFRHAFFNAMNSNDARDIVARLFSTAHESEVPANLILEVQMDLHNNNVGHIIGENASFFVSDNDLSNSVYSELLAGNLFYLSPLDAVIIPPNFGINSSTQLTPTNQ